MNDKDFLELVKIAAIALGPYFATRSDATCHPNREAGEIMELAIALRKKFAAAHDEELQD